MHNVATEKGAFLKAAAFSSANFGVAQKREGKSEGVKLPHHVLKMHFGLMQIYKKFFLRNRRCVVQYFAEKGVSR